MNNQDKVKSVLSANGMTIPEICRLTKIYDEFRVLHAIAELEYSNEVFLEGFDKIYGEDGGAIYLAKYAKKAASMDIHF